MLAIALLLAAATPTIWGDGIHDDTDGMEALVCQQTFAYRPGSVKITHDEQGHQHIDMRDGIYLLPRGIPFPKNPQISISLPPVGADIYQVDCAARAVS